MQLRESTKEEFCERRVKNMGCQSEHGENGREERQKSPYKKQYKLLGSAEPIQELSGSI